MTPERCTFPTKSLRQCRRRASKAWYAGERKVAAGCPQHAAGIAHARMLRPTPWEYSHTVNLSTGEVTINQAARGWAS